MAGTAQADMDVVTVTSTTDPGDANCATNGCTLREAVGVTNDGDPGDHDEIVFQAGLSGTITLGSVLPTVVEPLEIEGPGAGTLTVSGNDLTRILHVSPTPGSNVTISDLTLSGGSSGFSAGGAIRARFADLAIHDATLSGNKTDGVEAHGGAIYTYGGTTTIEDSTLTGNMARGTGASGGAVYSWAATPGETTTIRRTTISGNSTTGDDGVGGALAAYGGTTAIEDSTITGNATNGEEAWGGGFATFFGARTIRNSTIGGNSTNGDSSVGGGLFSFYATTAVESSTISGNSTNAQDAVGGGMAMVGGASTVQSSTISGNNASGDLGGGIYWYGNDPGSALTLRNSTIANNSAAVGGGLYTYDVATVNNTILADNTASTYAPDVFAFANASFTLLENGEGAEVNATVPGSNIVGQDPGLMPLAANGGPTMTHALPASSVAVDCGRAFGEAMDQRGAGFVRPVDHPRTNSTATGADGSDIGAFELAGSTATGACANNTAAPSVVTPPAVIPQTPLAPTQPEKKKKRKKKRQKKRKKKKPK